MRKVKVLVSGRSIEDVRETKDLLNEIPSCSAGTRVISNGHADPLQGLLKLPDLLLLCDKDARGELTTLMEMDPKDRPALVVFGEGNDADAVRMAMRAGARDYLPLPINKDELLAIVEKVAEEVSARASSDEGSLDVFINGKGGSGATFLATNVAHGLASSNYSVTLVDLDLQFAGLCRYLDLSPEHDLLEAVQALDDMDEVSAEAFTSKHESGLQLLSTRTDKLQLNHEVSPERLITTLQVYRSFNDFVIVDLPRHIDLLNAAVLEAADRITVVTQQSLPHLHDTSRLVTILRDELGIGNEQLTVVVNRYAKDSAIHIKDIESALRIENIVKIPNHYKVTSESINTGIPLAEVARRASVAKGLRELYERIGGVEEPDGKSASRGLQSLFRR